MPLVRNLTAAEIVGQVLVARDRLGDFPGGVAPAEGLTPQGRGRARGVEHRLHGHGRSRSTITRRSVTRSPSSPTATACRYPSAASPSRPPASSPKCPDSGPSAERCSPSRCMRPTTRCATSSCLKSQISDSSAHQGLPRLSGASNARRITFEYVMLKGVNDSVAEAKALVRLLKGLPAKINLIPLQSVARKHVRMLRLGDDRALLGNRLQRGLRKPGPHAARA